jgi:hypothetical protein
MMLALIMRDDDCLHDTPVVLALMYRPEVACLWMARQGMQGIMATYGVHCRARLQQVRPCGYQSR